MTPLDGAVYRKTAAPGLRTNCLSYPEVLAQSVAVIAPSTVPAAVLGLIYASAGNATWLSFLFGMLGLSLVSLNINQFARHASSAGSLYSYIVTGLGSTTGLVGGCALLFGYMFTGMSTLCGFSLAVNNLLQGVGITVSPSLLSIAAMGATVLLAATDVRISTRGMLIAEGAAILAILALGTVILSRQGVVIDRQQLTLSGASPSGLLMGVVLVVFGFSGFESSTALGEEAMDPLRTIPRSVVQSVILSGVVFIFMAYVVVLGFHGLKQNLATTELPLVSLSDRYGLPWLGKFIAVGVVLSFFSCTLASVSATARIISSMARHHIVPKVLGTVSVRSRAPYVAIGFAALLTLLMTLGTSSLGVSDYDAQGYFGTLCSFGFLVVYLLISVAAPVYLRKRGLLSVRAVILGFLAAAFMVIPILGAIGIPGSSVFPPPRYPANLLVWMFLAFMLVSVGWLVTKQRLRAAKVDGVFNES